MKIKEILEELDVQKKFPGYFTKNVFRFFFIFFFLLMFLAYSMNDYKEYSTYFECPQEAQKPCRNPYYICQDGEYEENMRPCITFVKGKFLINQIKKENISKIKYIAQGRSIGEKANVLIEYGYFLLFLNIFLAFVVNHVLYIVRRKR